MSIKHAYSYRPKCPKCGSLRSKKKLLSMSAVRIGKYEYKCFDCSHKWIMQFRVLK